MLFVFAGYMPVSLAAQSEAKGGLMKLGDSAPDFSLPDVVTGETFSLSDFEGKTALLVMVICRHCPYVQHVKQGIGELAKEYADKNIAIIGISANDPEGYPADAPESLKEMAAQEGYAFPFLFDETQEAAKAFTAVATPEFFLFDGERKLVYRGQFDDSRPNSQTPVTGADVRAAIDAVLEGRPVAENQKRAMGCSIKWKPGNAPRY